MAATLLRPPMLRPMTPADLPAGQRLSAGFAWPHRLEDWALMLEIGEGLVAERDGAVAGTAMAWRYGEDAATVGMIMVPAALHGQGIGRAMLQALLDRLGGRTVRLNATPEGIKLYRDLGFVDGRPVIQHQVARLRDLPVPAEPVRPVGPADLPWIAAMDRAACGMDRSRLLAALLEVGSGIALERHGQPAAVALQRRFGRGQLVGPVLAADPADARTVTGHLLAGLAGQFVRIDIGEDPAFGSWLADLGIRPTPPMIGMTRGPDLVRTGPARTVALASQAYG